MKFKVGDKIIIDRPHGESGVHGGYYGGEEGIVTRVPSGKPWSNFIYSVDFSDNRIDFSVDEDEMRLRYYKRKRVTAERLPK